MEFFKNIWEKIKSFFYNKAEIVDQAAIDEARLQRLQELNDPDDAFDNDVAYDEKELATLARKAANKRNFRTGYYIFGSILAVGLVGWGLIGLLTTPKIDISILVQADGIVENADIEMIRNMVAQTAGDQNGDGKVVVEVTEISMPATHTEENETAFEVAREDIEEALIPLSIGLIFGREEFLDAAAEFNELAPEQIVLRDMAIEINENNPLGEYRVTYRLGQTAQAMLAKEVFDKLS